MANFYKSDEAERFMDVCRTQSRGLPPDGGAASTAEVDPENDELRLRLRAAELELRRLREAEQARAAAEKANRTRDEFLAAMSHELRTPLNAMLGWATLLRKDHSDPAMLARGLDVIERNARTQTRLVNDVLEMSRILNGTLRLSMRRTPVSAAISAAADLVRGAAEAKRVSLELGLDEGVGTTLADPDRLQQIMCNLLSNAVRLTPAGGRVTVAARREGSAIVIRVADTGCGISADQLPGIFDRFHQADGVVARRHGGLGIGLSVVRHLVEAHGGTVSAASEGDGLGATFTIRLPIPAVCLGEAPGAGVPSVTSEARAQGGADASTRRLDLSHVRALVVDDDADSLELVRLVLERSGAAVTTAADGYAALAAEGPFDIIISDIGMPAMDGYALVWQVRSRDTGARTPALALTACAHPLDADRALRAGYQEHIAKPVDASALIRAVERWTYWKRADGGTRRP